MSPRLPLPSNDRTPLGAPDARGLAPAVGRARSRLAKAVYGSPEPDPLVLELVRMRNARVQQCNL
ncbi:MAG: hypothetical protein ABI658_20190 [Acidimicrobiales bacterium]